MHPLKHYEKKLKEMEARLPDCTVLINDLLTDLKEFVTSHEPESLHSDEEKEKCPLFIQSFAETRFKIENNLEPFELNAPLKRELLVQLDQKETCIEENCQMWGPVEICRNEEFALFSCTLKREAFG